MPRPISELVALVNQYLPAEAKLSEGAGGYGWDDPYIENLILTNAYTPAQAVRYFWYQRTAETAEYLDMSKPLSQIHRQARDMLAYWDIIVQTNLNGMEPLDPSVNPNGHKAISFGEIERPVTR